MKDIVKILLLIGFLIVGKLSQAQCDFYGLALVSSSGFEAGAGFTQEFVLVDERSGLIKVVNSTGLFSNVTPGNYKIYAVNYDGARPSTLAVASLWSGVEAFDLAGNCIDISAPYLNRTLLFCDQICSGDPIVVSSSGFYTGGSSTQNYVLVANPSSGNILDSNLAGTFTSSEYGADGVYDIYAVNTEDVAVNGTLGTGSSWSTAETSIDANCAKLIGPYYVEVGAAACPVGLFSLKLDGVVKSHSNELHWNLISSNAVNYYEIYKSNGNGEFIFLEKVTKDNFSDEDYSVIDNYKVKVVFKNGKSKYSNVVSLERNDEFNILSVYPNPTTDLLTFSIQAKDENIRWSIINTLGQPIKSDYLNAVDGINTVTIDLSALPEAMYHLNVTNGVKIIQHKIVKF